MEDQYPANINQNHGLWDIYSYLLFRIEWHLKFLLKKSETLKFEQPGFFRGCCISSLAEQIFFS